MELSPTIVDALRLRPYPAIAFVGAGGKTAAMFEVARRMAPSITTTTTHLGDDQAALADAHLVWSSGASCGDLELAARGGVTLLTGEPDSAARRLRGLSAPQWSELRPWCADNGRVLLVEADGSRQRPLKAPARHEPAIPHPVDAVIVVAGLRGCGLPLDEEHVHRAARFSAISGWAVGEPVAPEALAIVLGHPDGGLKHIPPGVKRAVLLNQGDTPELRARAAAIAARLRSAYDVVAVASLRHGRFELL